MNRILLFLLVFSTPLLAQRANDITYVPTDNSVIVSQTAGMVGVYVGGQYFTSYPYPYAYTTPYSLINRFGAQIRLFKDVNLMVGGYAQNMGFSYPPNQLKPELWVKTGLFNTITQEINTYDLMVSIRVSKEFYYGLGVFIQW